MKHGLRKRMRQLLAEMPAPLAAAKSQAACARLVALEEFHRAGVVMIYLSMPGEVDTAQIALAAWRAGKTVLAPRVSWEQRHLLAMEIHSLGSGLVVGSYGIREPAEGGGPWPASEIDFIVVPALAYDRRGYRLGRGGGFYDRFLAERSVSPPAGQMRMVDASREGHRTVTCGLAFAEQVVDELPTAAHDRPVEMLVTDQEVLRFDVR